MKDTTGCRNKGFTIVELMIAMVVSIIVIGAIYAVYESQTRVQVTQEAVTELNESRRSTLAIMENEIRSAGADPTGMAGAGIIRAENDEFWFTRDITGDNNRFNRQINPDDGENIRYKLVNGNLGRDTAGNEVGNEDDNDLHTILANVNNLNFTYWVYDPATQSLQAYDASAHDLNDITRVDIEINAESSQEGRGFLTRGVHEIVLNASIQLRNLPRRLE